MILKSEAIVLRTFDFRETSRIATFFTKDYGKVKGVLKGIRKDPKKFGSSLEKFSVNDIVYYQYRNSEIHLISHCDLKSFFFPIRQDLKRTMAASYILELVDTIMPVEEANIPLYQLMLDYLSSLEKSEDISKLVYILQIKVLLHSGFRPHLDSCVFCRKKIKGRARFSLKQGGLLCPDCRDDSQTILINPGTIASILHVEKNDWKDNLRLGLSASIKKELKFVLNNFLVFHLEKQLKSTKFLP